MIQDHEIVDLFWQRDERALTETAGKYEKYLLKVAVNILFDTEDGMETVNDTYLRAWNGIPPGRPTYLSAFLAKITRRLAIDRYRKSHAQKRGGSEYELSLQELQESGFEAGEMESIPSEDELLGKLISRYLKQEVKAEARKMFVCRYFHNDSIKEICDNFGYGESKVKSSLQRTRNGLREYLSREGFEG